MSELSLRAELAIAKKINFRMLVYLYMYQHPTATKASLAKRLGMSPIAMSRAIASGKKGVGKAMALEVMEIMREVSFSEIQEDMDFIKRIMREQMRYERTEILRKILSYELSNHGSLEYNAVSPGNFDYVLLEYNGTKRYFSELYGDSMTVRRTIPRAMAVFCRFPGNDEVTLICYSKEVLSLLMSEYVWGIIRQYNAERRVTGMLVDLEKEKILAEYILHEPGKEMPSIYIPDVSSDFEDPDDL